MMRVYAEYVYIQTMDKNDIESISSAKNSKKLGLVGYLTKTEK